MKEQIKQAENILIVFPDKVSFDMVSAGLGLACSFSSDKNIDFYFDSKPKKSFLKLFDFDGFKIINQILDREIIVNIKKSDGNIKSVRWTQDEEKIKFIIKPESQKLDLEEVAFDVEGGKYDLFITIGCKSMPNAIDEKVNLEEVSTINIDTKEDNTQFANINKIKHNTSYSSLILKLIDDYSFSLTKNAIKNLYKGILVVEEGFRDSSADLLSNLENLSSFDKHLFDATVEAYDSLTLEQLRYMGKMISNLKVTQDNIIFSLIPYDQLRQVNLNQRIFPELNIVSRLKKFKLVFIISQIAEDTVEVNAYSKREEIDLFSTFEDFSPEGNSKRVTFKVETTLEEMEKKIRDTLNLKSNEKADDNESKNEDSKPLEQATNFPQPIAPPPIKQESKFNNNDQNSNTSQNNKNQNTPSQNKFPTESIRPLTPQ